MERACTQEANRPLTPVRLVARRVQHARCCGKGPQQYGPYADRLARPALSCVRLLRLSKLVCPNAESLGCCNTAFIVQSELVRQTPTPTGCVYRPNEYTSSTTRQQTTMQRLQRIVAP
jgi:hypothetical protein